jgi:hypothetical protein
MGNNAISAILNIAKFHNNNLKVYSSTYLNRINAVGEQLEFYVKDSLANSFKLSQNKKDFAYSKVFSYLGNQNNPPDMILKKGDAFEIKKIESPTSSLALNSSPPKDRLYSSDPRITESCRKCEQWSVKDLFYVIGYAKKGILNYLFFVHGLCYAADKSIYEKIHEPLKKEITSILDSRGLESGKTIELGKVKKVDPLGRTELRIRGMWSIKNPINAFSGICKLDKSKKFSLFSLIKKDKYDSFPPKDIEMLEKTKSIKVEDVEIKDPNNLAKNLDAKLIRIEW